MLEVGVDKLSSKIVVSDVTFKFTDLKEFVSSILVDLDISWSLLLLLLYIPLMLLLESKLIELSLELATATNWVAETTASDGKTSDLLTLLSIAISVGCYSSCGKVNVSLWSFKLLFFGFEHDWTSLMYLNSKFLES